MVLVPLGHADGAVEKRRVPLRVTGQVPPQAVRLNVGLVHDVEAVLVAQVVPAGIIRIMRRAHGVHVGFLQKGDVPEHAFLRHDVSQPGIMLVPVNAPETDGNTVDPQLSIPHLHFAKSHG